MSLLLRPQEYLHPSSQKLYWLYPWLYYLSGMIFLQTLRSSAWLDYCKAGDIKLSDRNARKRFSCLQVGNDRYPRTIDSGSGEGFLVFSHTLDICIIGHPSNSYQLCWKYAIWYFYQLGCPTDSIVLIFSLFSTYLLELIGIWMALYQVLVPNLPSRD